jgi:hypothetical protein
MQKNTVSELARSFSQSCQKIIQENKLLQKLPSPAVMLVAITVVNSMLLDIGADKRPGWYK